MTLKKLPLLAWILLAITLGVALGGILPQAIIRIFVTFNEIFSQLLGFFIPLIIIGLIPPAIVGVGSNAKKLLLITVLIAYGSTVLSGFFSYGISSAIFPNIFDSEHQIVESVEAQEIAPYFSIAIPPLMNVMTALVLAFLLGICIVSTGAPTLKTIAEEFKDIISRAISKVIVPLLPLYILGSFMVITAKGEGAETLMAFLKIIGIIFAMTLILLLLQFIVAGAIARQNPFKALLNMLPAYATALGTASSAATIPVTHKQVLQNAVSQEVAGFVVPLCATIHMSGSILKIVSCAVAVMITYGMPYDFGLFAGFICLLAITAVAAPGVPGGVIMASLGVLSSVLGFQMEQETLMITLYIIMDSFGTACNVTGDGAIAMIIERIKNK